MSTPGSVSGINGITLSRARWVRDLLIFSKVGPGKRRRPDRSLYADELIYILQADTQFPLHWDKWSATSLPPSDMQILIKNRQDEVLFYA